MPFGFVYTKRYTPRMLAKARRERFALIDAAFKAGLLDVDEPLPPPEPEVVKVAPAPPTPIVNVFNVTKAADHNTRTVRMRRDSDGHLFADVTES